MIIPTPDLSEYEGYFERYVNLVRHQNVLLVLENQVGKLQEKLGALSEQKALLPYAEGKWTPKEVMGHLTDTERIMACRALCFSRGEKQPLPGFDENAYVAHALFNRLPMPELLHDHLVVRQATLRLFQNMDQDMLRYRGTASSCTLSVRAIAFIIAGHELHHLQMLHDRYGL
jgi:hypothetical protein